MAILVCSTKFLKYLTPEQLDQYEQELAKLESEEPDCKADCELTRQHLAEARADSAKRRVEGSG